MKYLKFLFGVMVCALLFGCAEKPVISVGEKLQGVNYDSLNMFMYLPDGKFVKVDDKTIDGIKYILGVDGSMDVLYVEVTDTLFQLDNMHVNQMLPPEYLNAQMKYAPGWGYYVPVNKTWYIGLADQGIPNNQSTIGWFFQFNFEGKK